MHDVTTLEQLLALYDETVPGAIAKQQTTLHPHYQALIQASPFCAIATAGPGGLDCSPRGDAPGFVRVVDESTLELPDRRGNNRLDSLRNIIANPRIALLFLIPGRRESMRVNGLSDHYDRSGCAGQARRGRQAAGDGDSSSRPDGLLPVRQGPGSFGFVATGPVG